MYKKLGVAATSAAIVLSVVTPAFAGGHSHSSSSLKVYNKAHVDNDVTTKANSGDNEISGFVVAGGKIKTGDAWASSTVVNDVNNTSTGCGCSGNNKAKVKNRANVDNDVTTKANSGNNEIEGAVVVGGKISTGDAGADAGVVNFVNTTSTGSSN